MSEFWRYLAEAAAWSLLGFVGGFLVGRTARDVHRIARAVTEEDAMTHNPEPEPGKPRFRPTGQFVLGVVVLVLAILTVVQGVITNNATRRLTECQSTYSNGFADALEARSNATAQAQEALDQLISAVSRDLPRPAAQEERVRAFQLYQQSREHAKREQREHPYPPPPRECAK